MLRSVVLSGAFLFLLTTAAAEGSCGQDSLPCDDGQCVRRENWCDGSEACKDGSDEAYCKAQNWFGISPNKCNKELHFRCEDGLCWPLAAHCDGTNDCRDASDEQECDSKPKISDSSEENNDNLEETKDITEDNKSKESSEEEKEESKDSSEEEKEESKDSSEEEKEESKETSEEENEESKETSEIYGISKQTTQTPSSTTTTPEEYDDYDEYEYSTVDLPLQTTTTKYIPKTLQSFDAVPSIESSPVAPFWSSTTETDFYAKKREENKVKQQQSTRANDFSTSTYRPPSVTNFARYSTARPFITQHPPSRKSATRYFGPTRAYSPRPYRYIGTRNSGQMPISYRGQHPVHNPSSSYRQSNHRQQFQNLHNNNGRSDWQNEGTLRVYERQLRHPSRFYFKKSYDELFGRANRESARRGAEWILSVRNVSGGWGKETPRALIALSLLNNSFLIGSHERDVMQKYFQVHLGVNLLRNEPVSLSRLAMFVNALIATCQDPRDFHGWDLTELIRSTIRKSHRTSRQPTINPTVYLSLCLADRNLTHYEIHHLMTYLVATRNDEATRDMTSLALEAFACHMQKEVRNEAQYYSLQKLVWNATSKILQKRKEDGSFGSVYSTAIAAKALMSVNESVEWNPEPTFRFLKSHQQMDGSFGDFLATYHVLPVLSGRSLLHLRNTECNPPRVDRELTPEEILRHPGPKTYIRYSLHMGSPLATGHTVQVLVPTGISFYDVMRVAAHENNYFKFSYEEVNGKINVYSISDLPNDAEEGVAWRLYVRNPSDFGSIPNVQQLYTGDIRELKPTSDQHLIFWYHPLSF